MAFENNGSAREDAPSRRRAPRRRRKVCVFCGKDNVIDYKDAAPETAQSIRELSLWR